MLAHFLHTSNVAPSYPPFGASDGRHTLAWLYAQRNPTSSVGSLQLVWRGVAWRSLLVRLPFRSRSRAASAAASCTALRCAAVSPERVKPRCGGRLGKVPTAMRASTGLGWGRASERRLKRRLGCTVSSLTCEAPIPTYASTAPLHLCRNKGIYPHLPP